jgi:hypothetical protein
MKVAFVTLNTECIICSILYIRCVRRFLRLPSWWIKCGEQLLPCELLPCTSHGSPYWTKWSQILDMTAGPKCGRAPASNTTCPHCSHFLGVANQSASLNLSAGPSTLPPQSVIAGCGRERDGAAGVGPRMLLRMCLLT